MEPLTNGTAIKEHIEAILQELSERKAKTESQISAAEELLRLVTNPASSGSLDSATTLSNATSGQSVTRIPDVSGMSLTEAIVAYALASPNGVISSSQLSKQLYPQVSDSYKSPESLQATIYYNLKRDDRFIRVSPGNFRFTDMGAKVRDVARSVNTPARYGNVHRGRQLQRDIAVGRNHSLVNIPPSLVGFPFASLHGLSYLEAAAKLASFLGGSFSTNEMTAAFWMGDLVPTAIDPGGIRRNVWSSLNTGSGLQIFRKEGSQYFLR